MKKSIKPAKGISTPNPDRNAGNAISRMPRAVRDKVSHALEDGADWKMVASICKSAGFPGVRPQNVTNYKKGAHQDWLRKEERMEVIRRDSESTAAVIDHYVRNGGSPAEAGLLAASEIMSKALAGMGPEAMKELVSADPKALFAVTRELARVAELLNRKGAGTAATPEAAPAGPQMTEEEQAAKVVELVDAALFTKGK
ncbi:MAG: hypothetical protein ABIS50_15170 [Luteolibacter sp.]|uniref:hypothetical protein n=1 Tax=Luteolibacter sp. TaxID=1962973 RepID=UPI0032648776